VGRAGAKRFTPRRSSGTRSLRGRARDTARSTNPRPSRTCAATASALWTRALAPLLIDRDAGVTALDGAGMLLGISLAGGTPGRSPWCAHCSNAATSPSPADRQSRPALTLTPPMTRTDAQIDHLPTRWRASAPRGPARDRPGGAWLDARGAAASHPRSKRFSRAAPMPIRSSSRDALALGLIACKPPRSLPLDRDCAP